MAESAPHPERFVGMHFFNPVDRMELVEVIRGEKTSDETVATIVALAKQIRKTPIVVKDCAGFLVNRVLFPYMNESLILLQDGASVEAIDRAATKFGMPMGPLILTDLVGLDTAVYAGKVVAKAYPDRTVTSPILEEMLKASPGDKKSLMKFWLSDKKSKPQPNPAALAIIAKHRKGEASHRTGRDHRPAVLAHALGGDARARGRDRPRAGGRRHGPDPGDRLPAVPRRDSPLVRQSGRGRCRRKTGEVLASRASDSSRPSRCSGWRRRAKRFILAPRTGLAGCLNQHTHARRRILPMKNAVVIDAVRTPVGRASADKGYFRDVRSEDLSAHVDAGAPEADGHRAQGDRRRALGLRDAAGRTGFRHRPNRRDGRRPAAGDRAA